jgi:OHCU decarboxylase
MKANPAEYEMIAPASLDAVVTLLAREPGTWLPIAGGTDVMVQYGAGTLKARKLVSIWNLPEVRRIEVTAGEVRIGSGCTYTDIGKHADVRSEFRLLRSSSRWTGGVANQNRGTIGGNIVNGSPAADSLPALLVYEAELILVSVRGERRVTYADFHTGYKTNLLAEDELIRWICLPRRLFGYFQYTRKVGARNAQAISKVCIAALGRIQGGVVEDVRIAVGSVAPVPLRLKRTEDAIRQNPINSHLLLSTKKTVAAEIKPIDDIRSTARYRAAVAANLVVEFLRNLDSDGTSGQANSETDSLLRWNSLPAEQAAGIILPCCGSKAWAQKVADRRPFDDAEKLFSASDYVWNNLSPSDWLDAFKSHPRIGGPSPLSTSRASPEARSVEWSAEEQRDAATADAAVKDALAEANREYERRFNRTFIVCATGKSAAEMLQILRRRLPNDPETELQEAAEQQRLITRIRLKKWLQR